MKPRKTINRLEVVCVRESVASYNPCVKSSQDIFEYKGVLWAEGMPAQEEIWALFLNIKNKVIGKAMIARGSGQECVISPKELFRPAIMSGAFALILIHNHTSGDTTPSTEDRLLTVQMCEAGRLLGIKVLDHIILGDGYYSFRDEGIIS